MLTQAVNNFKIPEFENPTQTLDVTKHNQAFLLERETLRFLLLSDIDLDAKYKLCARFARKEDGTVENFLHLANNEDEKRNLFELLMEIFSNGRMLRLLSQITVIPKTDKCLIYKRLVEMGPRILTENTSREKGKKLEIFYLNSNL